MAHRTKEIHFEEHIESYLVNICEYEAEKNFRDDYVG